LLAPVYGWFTEGFDTKDFLEAMALLNELAAPSSVTNSATLPAAASIPQSIPRQLPVAAIEPRRAHLLQSLHRGAVSIV
jgi:hypothetical protein